MTALGRTYRLLVVRQPSGSYFGEEGNAVEITGMRVEFEVEKHLDATPNKAEVKITNLSETTRALFDQRPLKVYIEAGYGGDNRLLFVGDVRPGSGSVRDGTEWITRLVLRDGGRAFAHARVNRSYAPGTPAITVLRDAARSIGLELPRDLAAVPELAAGLPGGATLSGYAADELTRRLAPYGYTWSIQNGKLQVLRDEQTLPLTARVIEPPPVGGMIGTPRVSTPEPSSKKTKKRPTVEIRHVLDGALVPGLRIELRSASLRGAYKLRRVRHVFDSHGDAATEIEGVPA